MRVVARGEDEVGVVLTVNELRILYASICAVPVRELRVELNEARTPCLMECTKLITPFQKELQEVVQNLGLHDA